MLRESSPRPLESGIICFRIGEADATIVGVMLYRSPRPLRLPLENGPLGSKTGKSEVRISTIRPLPRRLQAR